ncbi:MAG: four helix bundle protein [Planctomycetes bacterium]|nr:four helix bundle protein [Planctomycetota bacterium]
MDENEFKARTRNFAKRVARVGDSLPGKRSADVIARQVIRSGFSVSSNYRAACRAKSTRDMISKLSIVEEEADETVDWLEMIVELDLMPPDDLHALIKEGNELVAMTVASIRTLRRKLRE